MWFPLTTWSTAFPISCCIIVIWPVQHPSMTLRLDDIEAQHGQTSCHLGLAISYIIASIKHYIHLYPWKHSFFHIHSGFPMKATTSRTGKLIPRSSKQKPCLLEKAPDDDFHRAWNPFKAPVESYDNPFYQTHMISFTHWAIISTFLSASIYEKIMRWMGPKAFGQSS